MISKNCFLIIIRFSNTMQCTVYHPVKNNREVQVLKKSHEVKLPLFELISTSWLKTSGTSAVGTRCGQESEASSRDDV